MAIALGTKAPDFTLKTKRGEDLKDVKLSDNFGKKKTVLLFFPLPEAVRQSRPERKTDNEKKNPADGNAAYENLQVTGRKQTLARQCGAYCTTFKSRHIAGGPSQQT
jgi:hypothetical protein